MRYYVLIEHGSQNDSRPRIDEVTYEKLTPLGQSYYELEEIEEDNTIEGDGADAIL